jgi:hypothetical protein
MVENNMPETSEQSAPLELLSDRDPRDLFLASFPSEVHGLDDSGKDSLAQRLHEKFSPRVLSGCPAGLERL